MKKTALFLFGIMLAACSQNTETTDSEALENEMDKVEIAENELEIYGDEDVTLEGAIPASEVYEKLQGADSMQVKITGKINHICQKKGCWMKVDAGGDKEVRVRFKDYAFFVPMDAADRTATMEGWAYRKVISVDELRHLAEDAGKSEEEIAAISEPKEEVTFMARGVIIQ